MMTQDPELSAALGWPGGISDPVLDRKVLLQQVAALRAALAQQAEPVEPGAWSGYDLDGMVEAFSRVIEAHYQRANPFQHPIDMDAQMALRALRGFIPAMKAYTAPPQRKPLPKHDQHCVDVPGYGLTAVRLVRAVERAHGIKE